MAIRANFAKAKAAGLPLSMIDIENAVDAYNSQICRQNGWTRFLQETPAQSPFPMPHQPSVPLTLRQRISRSASAVAAGTRTLLEWIASGAEAVPQEQANARAAVCARCPVNSMNAPDMADKPLSQWFTVPAANAIKAALSMRDEWGLSTPDDVKLGVCLGCECVMRLKVHVPLNKFLSKMTVEGKAGLDKNCWVLAEEKKL